MGGVVIGELEACVPTVFPVEWPADVKANLVSEKNQNGKITNSDLEMAGLLLLWLMMEKVCGFKPASYVALFSALGQTNGSKRLFSGWTTAEGAGAAHEGAGSVAFNHD